MAGSPFKDAWRTRLATHRAAIPLIAFPVKDTDNTSDQAGVPSAADVGHLELEFPGGPPDDQYTFGSPGNNLHDETGQVTLRVVTRLRAGVTVRDAAEAAAEGLRKKFRADRFGTSEGRVVRVTGVSPISDGHDEGGNYVLSVHFAYQIYNVG